MNKIQSLVTDLQKAWARLEEAFKLPVTQINQDASIKRFELAFELSWKLMQTVLAENGIEAYGPKNIIREAAKLGLITDLQEWFELLRSRNLAVHVYKEILAKEVYQKAKKTPLMINELLENIQKTLSTTSRSSKTEKS